MGNEPEAAPVAEPALEPTVTWAAEGPYYTPAMATSDEKSLADYARHAVSSMRHLRHRLANTSLAIREGHEQRARKLLGGLVREDKELHEKVEAATAGPPTEARDRWWYLACQDSHEPHKPDADPPAPPERVPGFRGCLEVEFLCVQEEPPLVREDGTKAVDPVCQFSLEGRNTGTLRASNSKVDSEYKPVSSARFVFQEVAGVDLRVNVFDSGSTRFKMGFEHQAFCGGIFVPLVTVIERGAQSGLTRGLGERLICRSFETRLSMALLPLDLLRTSDKLQPALVTGAPRPLREHGHILLCLKLTLYTPQFGLYLMGPVLAPPHREALLAQVGDPLSVVKAAAAAVSRARRAVDLGAWLAVASELSNEPVCATLLFSWWTYATLRAKVCTWPLLGVAVLPLFTWRMNAMVSRAAKERPVRMYRDEVPPQPQPEIAVAKPPRERVHEAMKEAVNAQLAVMQLVDMAGQAVGHLERMVHVLEMRDSLPSALCGLVATGLASGMGGAILIVQRLAEAGYLRYLLWLAGCDYFLPVRWRGPVVALHESILWATERCLRRSLKLLAPVWYRVPNGPEAVHLALFERYVLISST